MPFGRKYGNLISTLVTRLVSNYPVKDAQSGFRAFSREAALRLNILSDYTYVQETIIQAVDKRLKRIEQIIDTLQISLLQRVSEYVTDIKDIKNEIEETHKTMKAGHHSLHGGERHAAHHTEHHAVHHAAHSTHHKGKKRTP